MRITPLAVFTSKFSRQNVRDLIVADVSMTHPNLVVHDAVVIYCEAIHYLLNNPDESLRAIHAYDIALESSKDVPSNETTELGDKCISNWL
jgi:ADP-ribosylglycohydrolase